MLDPSAIAGRESNASSPQPLWARLLIGMPGVLLAFLWGLAEGTFFFVVPDVAITLVAMLQPRRAWRHILASIAGSVIGGAVLFSWSTSNPLAARQAVARVPFITAKMIANVHASFERHGMGAVFLGPPAGTPYKIYAVEAPEFVSKSAFLWATAPARGERFVLVWIVFGIAGSLLRRFLRRTPAQLAFRHACFWIVFYTFYWTVIVRR
jgi:membrane protein YqaA with SNARE-associated domain